MAGKFINTNHQETIENLIKSQVGQYRAPYYKHQDKQCIYATYYNQNLDMSTQDEGSALQNQFIGSESPLRFNKIYNFCMLGMEKISAALENGEYGLESSPIEGDLIVMPDTIIPVANDYFIIDHVQQHKEQKKLIFKVTQVDADSLDDGSREFKVSYKLDRVGEEEIDRQVVEEYTMIIDNNETQYKSIIKKVDYDLVNDLGGLCRNLCKYYKSLFYSPRVDTFIFRHNGYNMYDPYMIEFLIRNEVLSYDDDYLFINHKCSKLATFPLDYNKTIFAFLEDKNRKGNPLIYSQGFPILEPLSVFDCRMEHYFKIEYCNEVFDRGRGIINNFNEELFERCNTNTYYLEEKDRYKNVIIRYFNNGKIGKDDILDIESMQYSNDIEFFYNIPIIIYILGLKVAELMK